MARPHIQITETRWYARMRCTETRELRPQPARFPNSHFATHLQYSVLYQQVMGLCVLPVSAPSPGLKIIIFRPAAQLQPLISMSTTQAHGHDRTEIDTAHHPNTSLCRHARRAVVISTAHQLGHSDTRRKRNAIAMQGLVPCDLSHDQPFRSHARLSQSGLCDIIVYLTGTCERRRPRIRLNSMRILSMSALLHALYHGTRTMITRARHIIALSVRFVVLESRVASANRQSC